MARREPPVYEQAIWVGQLRSMGVVAAYPTDVLDDRRMEFVPDSPYFGGHELAVGDLVAIGNSRAFGLYRVTKRVLNVLGDFWYGCRRE